MTLFLVCFTTGSSFLLSFLLFFHPSQENLRANRWLAFFVFIMGCAFASTFLLVTGKSISYSRLFKFLTSLQFLLAPSFYLSILYFVNPLKYFKRTDWIHTLPFFAYSLIEIFFAPGKRSTSTYTLFVINEDVSFLVRDLLPFLTLFYLIKSYRVLVRHRSNLKLISSNINKTDLGWLVQFLFILLLTVIIWINDALLELPLLTQATPFVYTAAIFFLAYFSVKQKAIFAFKEKEIEEIAAVFESVSHKPLPSQVDQVVSINDGGSPPNLAEPPLVAKQKSKANRLTPEQVHTFSARLTTLMEKEKLFLDNELSLPMVAKELGISIHETSFLINDTTRMNFYTYINRYRVEEAKKLLSSSKMEELNILGIAFASGFNSKTTFNTTFKKMVGVSPSGFSKQYKK